ncbi:MAG: FAD-dependent oxidoreductase, partial [Methylophilaceae bacterium]|nr:FAD-dependent oxidoreductase [Methylophilaceae bacterium]
MPYRLLRFALRKEHKEPPFFEQPAQLKSSYDAVIIGGGGHGLAAAYYLAKDHGISNIAVLEKGYLGGGNTGRNTTIVRSNYLTPEGVKFYDASVKLFQGLSEDLDINLFYSERGHFTLAHTESAMRTMRWRAEVNKHVGVDSYVVGPEDIAKACPQLDISCSGKSPILGALYHPPGSIVRHDAVAWGYARGAKQHGAEIFQNTEVSGIDVKAGKVVGVQTSRGYIATNRVLSAVAGFTPRICNMVGIETPIVIQPLQACVTEPMKPWLNQILVSGSLHVYVSQSSRGELVMGASLDPYEVHSTRSSLEFVEGLSAHILDMFPFLSNVKVVRQW